MFDGSGSFSVKAIWVTIVLTAVNLLLYVFPALFHLPMRLQPLLSLWGLTVDGIQKGEYYRLLTSAFLHFDIKHVVYNLLALFFLGAVLEKISGHLKFAWLCVLGGVTANVVSYFWYLSSNQNVLSAGASGVVFSLVGCMIAAAVKKVPGSLDIKRLIIYALLSLYAGFTSSTTNNIAHLSGLLAGFLYGVILLRRDKDPSM